MTVWTEEQLRLTSECGPDCIGVDGVCVGSCAASHQAPPPNDDETGECEACGAPSAGCRALVLAIVFVLGVVGGLVVGFGLGIFWTTHFMTGGAK